MGEGSRCPSPIMMRAEQVRRRRGRGEQLVSFLVDVPLTVRVAQYRGPAPSRFDLSSYHMDISTLNIDEPECGLVVLFLKRPE